MTGLQISRAWLAFAVAALMAPAAQGDPAAQTLDIAAFEQLKALAGRWEGTMEAPATGPATIEFEVTSNGRAVLERQFGGTSHEMITVYSALSEEPMKPEEVKKIVEEFNSDLKRIAKLQFCDDWSLDPSTGNIIRKTKYIILGYEVPREQGLPPSYKAMFRIKP